MPQTTGIDSDTNTRFSAGLHCQAQKGRRTELDSNGEEDDLGVQETTTAGLDLDLLRKRGKNRRRQAFETLELWRTLELWSNYGERWNSNRQH